MSLPDTASFLSKPRRTAELLAEQLIEDIKNETIKACDPLPTERELCIRFNTSRPTVREALATLQAKGYMTTSSGKRPRAEIPSVKNVILSAGKSIQEILGDSESGVHLEQMRLFIEVGAVREVVQKVNQLQIMQIQTTLKANFDAMGTNNFPATDIAFHRALVSVIDNPIILMLHDMFVSTLLAQRTPVTDKVKHDQLIYEEHRTIYEAVVSGDVIASTDIMNHHLMRSYVRRLKEPEKIADVNKDSDEEN